VARVLADDLDGTIDSEKAPVLPWFFSFGPKGNQRMFSIDPFIEKASPTNATSIMPVPAKTGGSGRRSPNRSSEEKAAEEAVKAAKTEQRAQLMAWGESKGYKIGDRGRIKAEYLTEFYAEHKDLEQML
jgi:hypothetical protein